MSNYDIYLDLDGVCSSFDDHCRSIFGKTASEFEHKSKFWSAVQHHDTNVEKFFRHMPKCDGADILVHFCSDYFRSVKFLTASGFTPKDGPRQKIAWCAEHYPNIECIVVDKSPNKAKYARPDAILVDDREKSTTPFILNGGNAILHTSIPDTIAQLMQYHN